MIAMVEKALLFYVSLSSLFLTRDAKIIQYTLQMCLAAVDN